MSEHVFPLSNDDDSLPEVSPVPAFSSCTRRLKDPGIVLSLQKGKKKAVRRFRKAIVTDIKTWLMGNTQWGQTSLVWANRYVAELEVLDRVKGKSAEELSTVALSFLKRLVHRFAELKRDLREEALSFGSLSEAKQFDADIAYNEVVLAIYGRLNAEARKKYRDAGEDFVSDAFLRPNIRERLVNREPESWLRFLTKAMEFAALDNFKYWGKQIRRDGKTVANPDKSQRQDVELDLVDAISSSEEKAGVIIAMACLDRKEHHLCYLLLLGKANQEAADILGVSLSTVKRMKQRIMELLPPIVQRAMPLVHEPEWMVLLQNMLDQVRLRLPERLQAEKAFLKWLQTPIVQLGRRTPPEMLKSTEGFNELCMYLDAKQFAVASS